MFKKIIKWRKFYINIKGKVFAFLLVYYLKINYALFYQFGKKTEKIFVNWAVLHIVLLVIL